jgi:pimeloyl-ACP methyl ester carboxylesterase
VILRDQVSQTTGAGGIGSLKASKGFNWNRFIIVSGISYFIICFILALSPFAQSLLLYLNFIRFPFGDLTNLHRFGLSHARNIRMTTKDGMVLKGYHLLPAHLRHWGSAGDASQSVNYDQLLQESDRVLIYFHGNAATRAAPFRLHAIKQMSYFMNSHVITFDYRGFGDSQGWPTEEGTYLDGLAAVQWVLERFNCVSRETFPPVYTSSDHGWADDDANTDSDPSQGLTSDSSALESLLSWLPFYRPVPPRGSGSADSVSSQITQLKKLYGEVTKSDSARLSQQTEVCLQRTTPKIYLYGQSLGSGIVSEVALRLNAYRPGTIQGVIYDAPFATAPRAAMTHPVGAPLRVFPFITHLLYVAHDTPCVCLSSSLFLRCR